MIVTIGGIPVYDAVISDSETGMFKISLVDDPAVMSNFQAFDNARKPLMYAVQDEEKRLCRGVVMRCDFPIYRYSQDMGEYYVIYRAEQIRVMAEKYLAEARQNNVNLMHQAGTDTDGVQMVQYFIKGAGVSVDGFEEIADGSLFAEFHVLDNGIWEAIKAGTYKGFSLEGVFDLVPEQDAERTGADVAALDGLFNRLFKNYKNMSKLQRFKETLARMLQEFGNITTDKGVIAWDGAEEIAVGDPVYIEDPEGNRTPAEDGDYTTEDNKVIVVVDGKVAEIKDAEVEPEAPAEPEPEAPVAMGSINTDNGVLSFDGEEIAVGMPVFVAGEDGENTAAPDGEYVAENGAVIVVADGVVAEIKEPEQQPEDPAPADAEVEALRAENAALKAEVENLKAQVEKMEKMPLAKPAHEEVTSVESKYQKTGVKGLDALARIMSAK